MLVIGFQGRANQPRRKPAGHAADRNKCTLQGGIALSRHLRVQQIALRLQLCQRRKSNVTYPLGSVGAFNRDGAWLSKYE